MQEDCHPTALTPRIGVKKTCRGLKRKKRVNRGPNSNADRGGQRKKKGRVTTPKTL